MTERLTLRVDRLTVVATAGSSVLDACDQAGKYVPRLCTLPGLVRTTTGHEEGCGLCVVRLGGGEMVRACVTRAQPGMEITTSDDGLRERRRELLAELMKDHPQACLLCPDAEGCARDTCTYGYPPEARCCDEYGNCELAALATFIGVIPSRPSSADVAFRRDPVTEGRIRREPGLCVACGRCVAVCDTAEGAGKALEMRMAPAGGRRREAGPKLGGLRASGCTFCGRCVLVCPTGALTVPGEAGRRWLERCRAASGLPSSVLPPGARLSLEEARSCLPAEPGVLQLFGPGGEVVYIIGVPDLARGLERALAEAGGTGATQAGAVTHVRWEEEPLYTQRESELLTRYVQGHGRLPAGNDPGEDLFDEEDGEDEE